MLNPPQSTSFPPPGKVNSLDFLSGESVTQSCNTQSNGSTKTMVHRFELGKDSVFLNFVNLNHDDLYKQAMKMYTCTE